MRIGDVGPERPPRLLAARTVGELVSQFRDDRDAARRFALAAADRIHAAHEVLGRLAERRVVVISERDSCPLV